MCILTLQYFLCRLLFICVQFYYFFYLLLSLSLKKVSRIIVNYELYCFIDLLIDENITEEENDAEDFFSIFRRSCLV